MEEFRRISHELSLVASRHDAIRLGALARKARRNAIADVRQLASGMNMKRLKLEIEALDQNISLHLTRCGVNELAFDRERLYDNTSYSASSSDQHQLRNRQQHKEDIKKKNASFDRTRNLLQIGLEQMTAAHETIDQDEAALYGINAQHKCVADGLRSARTFIRKLQIKQHRDELKLTFAIFLFYLVVTYIIWRRLPLKHFFRTLVSILVKFCFRKEEQHQHDINHTGYRNKEESFSVVPSSYTCGSSISFSYSYHHSHCDSTQST